jgi:hypothetical protein
MKTKKDIQNIDDFILGARDNNITDDRNVSDNVSIDGNITIIKELKDEGLERVSFYMKPSTYKKLKKVAKESDMGISEFHQKLIENVLNKIVIEEVKK